MSDNFNPMLIGAETTDMETGMYQDLTDGIKYGVPAVATTAALSLYNTALDYFGKDKIDIQETLTNYSEKAGDYYAEHKQGVDLLGGVLGSMVPGGLAVKGIQLARAGAAVGSFGRALGFASSRKDKYLQAAIQEIGSTGGLIPKLTNVNRLKSVGWEAADQVLLNSAFEAAAIAFIHDAPMFDEFTYADFAKNAAIGVGVGGLIGTGINSLMAKGVYKSASEAVQARSRQIDVVFEADKLALSKGTETFALAKEIAMLPEVAKEIPFTYSLDGAKKSMIIDSEAAMLKAKERAVKTATNKLAIKFTELAENDGTIGQAYYELITRGMEAATSLGKSQDEVVNVVHGYLNNVSKISNISLDRYALDLKTWYIDSMPKGDTPWEQLKNTLVPERSATTGRQGYRFIDNMADSDLVIAHIDDVGGKNAKEAFALRPDVDMLTMSDGKRIVNPKSAVIKYASDKPYVVRKYVHLETGTSMRETIPTFADIVSKGDVRVTDSAIAAGSVKSFPQAASVATHTIADPLEASARWAWAGRMDWAQLLRVSKGTIDIQDLPLVARLRELAPTVETSTLAKLQIKEGTQLVPAYEYINFGEALHGGRRDLLVKLFTDATAAGKSAPNTQVLAAYLNTSVDYVESMIAGKFKLANMAPELLAKNLDTASALVPKNVMVEWNFGVAKQLLPEEAYRLNMGPNHMMAKELTSQYQIMIRKDIGAKMQTLALGEHAALFDAAPDVKTGQVSTTGAGSSTLGASNADYIQKAAMWAQDTGKAVALTVQRIRDTTIEALSHSVNAIRLSHQASAELGAITTALRRSPLRFSIANDVDSAGDPIARLISREAKRLMDTGEFPNLDDAVEFAVSQDGLIHSYPVANKSVIEFLSTNVLQNDARGGKFTGLYNAAGLTSSKRVAGEIYVPPVNTKRFPYFAFVKPKQTVGLGSDVTMITARSEDELRKYADKLADKFDIHYKADTDAYYKAKGEYDYQMTVNESGINAELHRAGVLADVMPESRAENVLTDWLEWTAKEDEKLVRTAVQVGNRQFFSELNFLSENYRTVSESQARGLGAKLKRKIADPFDDYVKTALNISKQGEFPLLDSLNELIDKVGYTAGEAIATARSSAQSGYLPWQDAQKVMKNYGLGQGLDESLYHIVNGVYPSNVIKDTLAKGNMWLATTTLRLDFINPLINMISTPIMIGTEVSALRRIMAGDSELAAKFQDVMSVAGPGGRKMPSTTAMIGKSINNFFGADKAVLFERYKKIGAIKDVSQLYHEVLDDLSYTSSINTSKWGDKVSAAVERGAKLTGNTFAEDFTRFVSADVMKQLSDPLIAAGKLTEKEQNTFISTFVNKVQGNYVTSQRPVVFQGTTGAAVSLFQTYAFNVLQQLTRHIQNGDKRTLAIFAGLQGSMFGLNGLPFFDAVNTHLVGSWLAGNPQHNDSYNILPKFNKELGDWMLYGSASAFPLFSDRAPALYTRGDINPRHLTVLPTSFVDIPLVQASLKMFDTVTGFAGNVGKGAEVSTAMLQALEHQGWNRPLAGFAQTLAGQATNSKGALISAASDLETTGKLASLQNRLVDFGGATRMLGAKPMDESIALNNLYRNKDYDALDKDRIERLGSVVKTKLYGNQVPSDEEMENFMTRYTRSGGRIENFSQSMQRWSKDANTSVVNQTLAKVRSPGGIKLQMIMGGEGLDDYAHGAVQSEVDSGL